MESIKNSHEKVEPTAWGIAARRADCDIPYAKEILGELMKVMTPEEKLKMEALTSEKDRALTPQFEARYKLLNRLLQKTNVKQVLELAAGISPRGIVMSQDPEMTYIEVDLPGIIRQKKEIVDALTRQTIIPKQENLHLASKNVLGDLSEVTTHFDSTKPVAVIHEGLMRYLKFDEKAQVAQSVKKILQKFGGVYITPDITLKVFVDERVQKIVSNLVGMDINANAFESVESAEKFFDDLGFKIEKHSFTEARDELVSPQRLGLSEEQVKSAIDKAVFFVMRLKSR